MTNKGWYAIKPNQTPIILNYDMHSFTFEIKVADDSIILSCNFRLRFKHYKFENV